MKNLIALLLMCRHTFSFPITRGGVTYQTCTKCGEEFEFDVQEWRRVS